MTAARGVCAGIASKLATQRAPSARRIFPISSVSRLSVPLTIRNARTAFSRSICSTIASAAGRPNTTSSMAPNTTRPLCTRLSSPDSLALLAGRLAEEIQAVMSEDAGLTAVIPGQRVALSPESILTMVVMDSGLDASASPRNDELNEQPGNFPNRHAPLRQQHFRRLPLPFALPRRQRILRAQAMFQHQPRIERAARIGAGTGWLPMSSARRW